MLKPTLFLSIIIILGACNGESDQNPDNNPNEDRSTSVLGYEVKNQDMSRTISVSDNIESLKIINLASRMSGTITELKVQEGDRVSEGEVVARLDVAEQKAELNRARSQFENKRANYNRASELKENDHISQAEYDEARAEKAVAESEVELWQTRVEFGAVRAPEDAIVTQKHVEVGSAVSENEPLFRIEDISTLVMRVGISELDVTELEPGDEVGLRLDAYPENEFTSHIRRIFPSAEAESRLVTVEMEIGNPDVNITPRPGFLARARIPVDRREDTMAIPSEALLASERDESFIYVIDQDDKTISRRDVSRGVERRNWTEILSGLEHGEVIVANNPTNLSDGERVRISQWVEEEEEIEEVEEFDEEVQVE